MQEFDEIDQHSAQFHVELQEWNQPLTEIAGPTLRRKALAERYLAPDDGGKIAPSDSVRFSASSRN